MENCAWNVITQLYEQKLRTDASLMVRWYWAGVYFRHWSHVTAWLDLACKVITL